MSCVDVLSNLSSLFEYKTISGHDGEEFVVLPSSELELIDYQIDDKTAFEAVENHVHIFYGIKKKEIPELVKASNIIGKSILNNLKFCYPDKEFVVFVSFRLGDSMIIRFHQMWLNEKSYYDINDFTNSDEVVLMFKG